MNVEYKLLKVDELEPFMLRELRKTVLAKLEERIREWYNSAKPLSVVHLNGKYIVVDGNHRLEIIKKLGIEEVPCAIYCDVDNLYKLSVDSNLDEDTYAPLDLFDWLAIIRKLREEGKTQQEIADTLGWSREKVKNYVAVLDKVGTQILEIAKKYQVGRVPQDGTNVPTFNFTEGWFRNSGIYELEPEFQLEFIKWFCEEKRCKVAKSLLKEKIITLKDIQEQLKIIEEKLSPDIDKAKVEELIEAVRRGEYTTDRLLKVIDKLNEGTKNRALFGVDALEELKKLDDGCVDCVVTDPPWGVEFKSARETENPDYDVSLEEILPYLDKVFAETQRVCKDNAHIYVFFPTMYYTEYRAMLEKYFDVDPIPLIWVKNNHNPCDYKRRYAQMYETIFFCKMPNGDLRKLNNSVSPNVLRYSKPTNKIHDSQKPVELLEYLIKNSTAKGETVLDMFAGSGSTLIAAYKSGRYFIGFEKDKSYESKFRRWFREVGGDM